MIRPNLNALVNYASVPTSRRLGQAQRARAQAESEYLPATDFWKQMRTAIRWDRKTTRDGSAVRDISESVNTKKKPSYQVLADAWPSIAARWDGGEAVKSPTRDHTIGGLTISVRPLFSELLPDGTIEHVIVWMNQAVPSPAAIDCAMRLLTMIDCRPNVRSVFVDARRGATYIGSAADLARCDGELTQVCVSFARDAA